LAKINEKKRHHYIPIAYLSAFADESRRVFAYRKDNRDEPPLHVRPEEIAFEKYYYSQPTPDGGRDNNTFEDFFSTYETKWPALIERLSSRITEPGDFDELRAFMILMRVRVPATRDMIEFSLAERVKSTTRVLDRKGLLPPKPEGLEDILDYMVVSIDPHMSLHAIPTLSQGFEKLLSFLEFEVLHNLTNLDILTSDNPVIVFDPHVPEAQVQPYQVRRPAGPVELIFPISPRLAIRGRRGPFRLIHNVLVDPRPVERINRFVSRFGYRFVFSRNRKSDTVIAAHSSTSPIGKVTSQVSPTGGEMLFLESVFGPRPAKPKWEAPKPDETALPPTASPSAA
jgi:hypothetical protein